MKRQMKSRICSFALAGVFASLMVGETLAFDWDQVIDTHNEFQPGNYDTDLAEDFIAPTNWLPGAYTNKDVWVVNDGTVPVFATITLSQEWVSKETEEVLELTFETDDGDTQYAAVIDWSDYVVALEANDFDIPVVDSIDDATGLWLFLEETADGDLVFYYMAVLEADSETLWLVDGVEMNPEIQAPIVETHTVWDKTEEGWVTTTTTVESPYDYCNATYTLSVTMTTVQATEAGMTDVFSSDTLSNQAILTQLAAMAITGEDVDVSRDDTVTVKKLYISESDGILSYTPSAPDENWFMSHLNMLPGETYTDTLEIANYASGDYDLYMQAILKDVPDDMQAALLDYITMTVTYNGEVIYQGSAAGEDVSDTLFQVIELGEYASGDTNEIQVSLTLDKDLPMDYAGILAATDWQFMVIKQSSGGGGYRPKDPSDPGSDPSDPGSDPDPETDIPDEDVPLGTVDPDPETDIPDEDVPLLDIPFDEIPLGVLPQTGDSTLNLVLYLAFMVFSGAGFVWCVKNIKKSYQKT